MSKENNNKKTIDMKTLYEVSTQGSQRYYTAKYVEHNGRKFRFICKTENGDPCGFKTNKCIQVMTSDGEFANVADCLMIGFPYQNDYFNTPKDERMYATNLFKAFEDFIEKVY